MKTKYLIPALMVGALLSMGADSCSEDLEEAEKASDKLEKLTEPNKNIDRQVQNVELGMTIDQVRSEMGPPDDQQVSKSQYAGTSTTLQYLYYGQWQLGFTDGVLDSKSKF
jgi:hypothetical protein